MSVGQIVLGVIIATQAFASVQSKFQFALPSPWQKISMKDADAAWAIPNSPTKATITVTSTVSDKPYDFGHMDQEKMVKLVETARSAIFAIFGITGWTVDKHSVTQSLIELHGHYVGSSGTPVHFVERDYFVGKIAYTVTFFEDSIGSHQQDDNKTKVLLDLFKPEKATE